MLLLWKADDLVCDVAGDVLHPEALTRGFRTIARKLGLDGARLHHLRHSAAREGTGRRRCV